MNRVEFTLPLKIGSTVRFYIDDTIYEGDVMMYSSTSVFIIHSDPTITQGEFVRKVFSPLQILPDEYYKQVLGKKCAGLWPESSIGDLEKILRTMRVDYSSPRLTDKPTIDFSKFRFKVGDYVTYSGKKHKIVGYYFPGKVNDYIHNYGYVISGPKGIHDGTGYGFDEHCRPLKPISTSNCLFVYEEEVEASSQPNNHKNKKQNGNEIKLQKTRSIISRGTVPAGCRVCCKVHKTAVSIKPLGYTEVSK